MLLVRLGVWSFFFSFSLVLLFSFLFLFFFFYIMSRGPGKLFGQVGCFVVERIFALDKLYIWRMAGIPTDKHLWPGFSPIFWHATATETLATLFFPLFCVFYLIVTPDITPSFCHCTYFLFLFLFTPCRSGFWQDNWGKVTNHIGEVHSQILWELFWKVQIVSLLMKIHMAATRW